MPARIYLLKQTALVYSAVFGLAILVTLAFRKTEWGRGILASMVSWLAIFLIFLLAAYAGTVAFSCLISVIAFLAVWEYYRLNRIWNVHFALLSGLLVAVSACSAMLGNLRLFYMVPGASAVLFLPSLLLNSSPGGANRDAGIGVIGLIYWGWVPLHFALLSRLDNGFGYLILLCSMVAIADNAAYYAGKLLGKGGKRLAPRISPGKTWIGAFGGFAATFLAAFVFRYAVPQLDYADLLFIALIVGLAIPVGDLVESAMKRDAGAKDSGSLIPGHGGIMDRFDSWTFAVPFFYYYVIHFCSTRGGQ